MSLPQQKSREIVFQLLYSYDIGQPQDDDMMELIMKELAVTKKNVRHAQERAHLIQEKLSEIDQRIAEASLSYAFERIQSVERNILRLGVYEILFDHTIPAKVAITEGMRLARKFGSPEAANFVNALLDQIYKKSEGKPVDPTQISMSAHQLIESEKLATEASKQPKVKKHPESDQEAE
jgi:transcription antitermination protein NusB